MRLFWLLLIGSLFLTGCLVESEPTVTSQTDLDKIKSRGALRVGIDPGYLPFEMKNMQGELIGFDIELARSIASELGVKVEFRDIDWDGIIPALVGGEIDLICSGMSITSERAEVVLFSEPYYQISQAVLLPKGSTVTAVDQLNEEGVLITVQTATTGEKAAREFLPLATSKGFDKQVEAALEVAQGRADAMIFDHPFVSIFSKRHAEETTALLDPFTKEDIGVAMRLGATDLKKAVDATVAELRKNGRMGELEKEFFADMPWLNDLGGE